MLFKYFSRQIQFSRQSCIFKYFSSLCKPWVLLSNQSLCLNGQMRRNTFLSLNILHIGTSIVKPVASGHSKKNQKYVFKTDSCLMQVKSIAKCPKEHSAILPTSMKLPCVIKIFVLSIFGWLFYTGFTVCWNMINNNPYLLNILLSVCLI